MKKLSLTACLFCLLFLPACSPRESRASDYRQALRELDEELAREGELIRMKEYRLSDLRSKLAASSNSLEEYWLCKEMYEEYAHYNADSALFYAHREEALARQTGDERLICSARLDLLYRYLVSGIYEEVLKGLQEMTLPADMDDEDLARYYQSYHSLYHNLVLTCSDIEVRAIYQKQEAEYREKSFSAMKAGMMNYYTIRATQFIENGQTARAREMMDSLRLAGNRSLEDMAIIHYYIGKTFRDEGNDDEALKHYAISSRYDFAGVRRASRSLVQTTRILLKKNRIQQAYTYTIRNYEDAITADARLCLNEIANYMPEVISSYNRLEKHRYSQLVTFLAFSLILLIISATGLLYVLRLQSRLEAANRNINTINGDLQKSVAKLEEANDIKDYYLGRYLSMFSAHINSLENYRSSLRIVAKSMDLHDIQQALKSDEFIDAERESLYREFDQTFLGIFPDFVQELNGLLQDGKHIGEDLPKGKLSNELRIFALIRLGVKESGLIARFLKKSPSTIYNYRVKLRNAAICPNDEFEERLMEIGKNA